MVIEPKVWESAIAALFHNVRHELAITQERQKVLQF